MNTQPSYSPKDVLNFDWPMLSMSGHVAASIDSNDQQTIQKVQVQTTSQKPQTPPQTHSC